MVGYAGAGSGFGFPAFLTRQRGSGAARAPGQTASGPPLQGVRISVNIAGLRERQLRVPVRTAPRSHRTLPGQCAELCRVSFTCLSPGQCGIWSRCVSGKSSRACVLQCGVTGGVLKIQPESRFGTGGIRSLLG